MGGDRNPPFDPLSLIKAGDVEQNPGPATPSANMVGDVAQGSDLATPSANKAGDVAQGTGSAITPAPNPATRVVTNDGGHSSGNNNISSPFVSDHQACHVCGRRDKINVNPYICSAPGCTEKCHQSCSGISRYTITPKSWACSAHTAQTSSGAVTLPTATLNQGMCHVCGTKIRKGVARLKCAVGVCNEECHKGKKCSNIIRGREKLDLWKCSSHSSLVKPRSPVPPPRPLTARNKTTCKGCRTRIRINHTPVVCSSCSHPFHKKCTKILRRDLQDEAAGGSYSWKCDPCEQKNNNQNYTQVVGGTKIETSAKDKNIRKLSKSSLRILQWNADGINTKADELGLRLKEDDYDICLIQETKLRENQRTPHFEGYISIRLDRSGRRGGGGLLTYIKNSLIFENVQATSCNGTEASTLRVRIGKKRWVVICNVYCPPVRSHSHPVCLETGCLPHSEDSIILGDFNAHNLLWDQFQPEDARGERLLDWVIAHDLTVMNDGSYTRLNTKARHETTSQSDVPVCPVSDSSQDSPPHRETSASKSAPDVPICGDNWRDV